jgi:hypothetical protein
MHTPLEHLLGETPDYTFCKVFGCACWPRIRPYNNRKLQFCSKQCVFLGYSSQHKGYKCIHIPTNRTYISRDAVFDEFIFPYSQIPSDSTLPSTSTLPLYSDQFVDAAYTPALLANHGAGRRAHLELLENKPETVVHAIRLVLVVSAESSSMQESACTPTGTTTQSPVHTSRKRASIRPH